MKTISITQHQAREGARPATSVPTSQRPAAGPQPMPMPECRSPMRPSHDRRRAAARKETSEDNNPGTQTADILLPPQSGNHQIAPLLFRLKRVPVATPPQAATPPI